MATTSIKSTSRTLTAITDEIKAFNKAHDKDDRISMSWSRESRQFRQSKKTGNVTLAQKGYSVSYMGLDNQLRIHIGDCNFILSETACGTNRLVAIRRYSEGMATADSIEREEKNIGAETSYLVSMGLLKVNVAKLIQRYACILETRLASAEEDA